MSRLTQYGVALAPNNVIVSLLQGALNAWSYDYSNPLNALREKSLELHNLVDEALGGYQNQLRVELSKLRKALPQPTRENPYPPMDGLEAVKDLEVYMRRVEHLRTRVSTAPLTSVDMVWHGEGDNTVLLANLQMLDVEVLQAVREIGPDTVDEIESLLNRRQAMLAGFRVE